MTCAVQALLERTFWNWKEAAALCQKKGYLAVLLAHAVSIATEEQLSQEAEMDGVSDVSILRDPAHCRAIIDTYEPNVVRERCVVGPQECLSQIRTPCVQLPLAHLLPDLQEICCDLVTGWKFLPHSDCF